MSLSRRSFLKWAGAANLTLAAGTTATAASNHQFEGYPDSKGVLYDNTYCIGCRKCEEGCNKVNELPAPDQPFDDLSVLENKRRTSNESFTVVNQYQPVDGTTGEIYRKIQCNHCLEPACAAACFVKALKKTPSGAVTYDASVCVGCRYCMVACPFEIPTYEYQEVLTPRVRKCTMCHPRITKGLQPGCVDSCPTEALVLGKREDLLKIARGRMRKHPDKYVDHIYGEKEMGGTNWLYLSGTRFAQIGLNENLGTKPAIEYTAGVLSAVPIVVGLWPVFLTGAYAMTKRRQKVAKQDIELAVAETLDQAKVKAEADLKKALTKADKTKKREIDNAVKNALAEAEKKGDDQNE
ncbi:MAG: 4Fe-4S dicluster domain-containing protein [Proteobacteria bacterium]|nr:4Fe-4S dicluster domain-containing protein [Pseudomonadota bacterium]